MATLNLSKAMEVQTLSARKIMATIFWDRKGVLLTNFIPSGVAINAEKYCEILKSSTELFKIEEAG